MDSYFEEIAESLTIDDLQVLGILTDHHVDAKFKSMKRSYLMELSKLTIADFRKVIHRLEITKFLEIVYGQKEHKIFITTFGQLAVTKSMQKVEKEKETAQNTEQSSAYKTRQIKNFGNRQ